MWHEARKQERRIRGMIVDYRKRAERRQDFYERIQADPTQFIQVHGRRCKIHLDPAVAAAGDGAAIIVPWQGNQDNLIDRFDVRAHLDYIPPVTKQSDAECTEISSDERQCNYERYRILAQNDFLNVTEEKFLHQLYLEEQFGANAQLEAERALNKKKQHKSGATIGYSYEDTESNVGPQPFSHLMNLAIQSTTAVATTKSEKGSDSDSESDIDMDVAIEVSKLDTAQAHELNACGRNYGMLSNDFYSFLTKDADEADAMRMAREEEQEKMLLSGRKSRRERRAQKERRIACRPFSPPSYAAKEEADGGKKENEDDSESRSPSPADANTGKITYITSFGGEDELQPHSKISINITKGLPQKSSTLGAACAGTLAAATAGGHVTYAQKVKENLDKLKEFTEKATSRRRKSYERTPISRSRSRSRRRSHKKSYSRSRSRSRVRDRQTERSRKKYSRRSSSSSIDKAKRRKIRSRSRSIIPQSRGTRRRRYSYSSTSSNTSSSSSSVSKNRKLSKKSRRSRTYSRSRSRQRSPKVSPKAREKPQETLKKVPVVATNPIISATKTISTSAPSSAAVEAPSMISYPLPLRALGIDVTIPPPPPPRTARTKSEDETAIDEPKLQVLPPPPLKRYYGRKRGNDTSSDSELESDTEMHQQVQPQPDATIKIVSKVPVAFESEDIDERTEVDTTSDPSNPLPSATPSTSIETQLQQQTGKYSVTLANNPSFSNASETKGGSSSISINTSTSNQGRLNLRERLKRKMQNLLNKQYKADKRAEIEKTERERQLQQEREDEMRELALKLRRRQRELRHKYGTPNSSKDSESDTSDTVAAASLNATEHRLRQSKSRSNERTSVMPTTTGSIKDNEPKRSREGDNLLERRLQQHRRSTSREHYARDRDCDRERNRSRSRSRPFYKKQQRRSRSRSRGRRSASRKRHRSPSRTRRVRESSHERSSRYGSDRNRRSRSRNERSSYRDRHERDRERERERDRDWREKERERDRDRDRIKDKERNRDQRIGGSSTSSTAASASSSRNRIVISAPPKLKKLVDY